jgi:hypothetical protein
MIHLRAAYLFIILLIVLGLLRAPAPTLLSISTPLFLCLAYSSTFKVEEACFLRTSPKSARLYGDALQKTGIFMKVLFCIEPIVVCRPIAR